MKTIVRFLILFFIMALGSAGNADGMQCPDCSKGSFGCGDLRVPYTVCTPWVKPTLDEWQRGWKWAPPTTMVTSIPIELVRLWDGRVVVSFCSLLADEPPRGMPPCSQARPTITSQSIRLDSWCAFLRALPFPPPNRNPLAVQQSERPNFGACGV